MGWGVRESGGRESVWEKDHATRHIVRSKRGKACLAHNSSAHDAEGARQFQAAIGFSVPPAMCGWARQAR